MTNEITFKAMSPEERERKEQELAEAENSDPNVCTGCGS